MENRDSSSGESKKEENEGVPPAQERTKEIIPKKKHNLKTLKEFTELYGKRYSNRNKASIKTHDNPTY